jgi:hypothetical protein
MTLMADRILRAFVTTHILVRLCFSNRIREFSDRYTNRQ